MNTGDNLVLTWTLSENTDWKFHCFWSLQSDLQESSSIPSSVRNLSVCEYSCLILDICFSISLKEVLGILNVWCHWKNAHCRPLLGHWICAPNSWDLQFPPRGALDLASVWVRVLTEMIGNRSRPKMWFKLYVKNSEQLVFSVQFLKEITTCFFTTL